MYTPARALLFRAYHRPTGEMFPVYSFTPWYVIKKATTSDDQVKNIQNPYLLRECVLMQFTGMYDKVGREVWEGDVLRWNFIATDFGPFAGQPDHSRYWHVIYHNGCFCFIGVGETDPATAEGFYFSDYTKGCLDDVVIGNLYEHSHYWHLTGDQPLQLNNTPYEKA